MTDCYEDHANQVIYHFSWPRMGLLVNKSASAKFNPLLNECPYSKYFPRCPMEMQRCLRQDFFFRRIYNLGDIKGCKPFNKQQWAQLMVEDSKDETEMTENRNPEVER